jgi:tRNA(fMet)-specific endonuclease VapC
VAPSSTPTSAPLAAHLAAQARSAGLVLVSNNLREFDRVPGLLTENWVA